MGHEMGTQSKEGIPNISHELNSIGIINSSRGKHRAQSEPRLNDRNTAALQWTNADVHVQSQVTLRMELGFFIAPVSRAQATARTPVQASIRTDGFAMASRSRECVQQLHGRDARALLSSKQLQSMQAQLQVQRSAAALLTRAQSDAQARRDLGKRSQRAARLPFTGASGRAGERARRRHQRAMTIDVCLAHVAREECESERTAISDSRSLGLC